MVATETMMCQETTTVMRRKAINACIRQGTTPTSYPTHIGVLKDKEGEPWCKDQQTTKRHIGIRNNLSLSLSTDLEKDSIRVKT